LENGKSSREIAQIMGVGRTQIQTINKRKAEIREDYEKNKVRGCDFQQILLFPFQ
jgi:transposase